MSLLCSNVPSVTYTRSLDRGMSRHAVVRTEMRVSRYVTLALKALRLLRVLCHATMSRLSRSLQFRGYSVTSQMSRYSSLYKTATSRICEALSLVLDLFLANVRAPTPPTPSRRRYRLLTLPAKADGPNRDCGKLSGNSLHSYLGAKLHKALVPSLVRWVQSVRASERAAGSFSLVDLECLRLRKPESRRGVVAPGIPGLSIPQRNTGLFSETWKSRARKNFYSYTRGFTAPMVLTAHSQFN